MKEIARVTLSSDKSVDMSLMTYKIAIGLCSRGPRMYEHFITYQREGDNMYVGEYHKFLHVVGRRFFSKTVRNCSISYINGKVFTNFVAADNFFMQHLADLFRWDFLIDKSNRNFFTPWVTTFLKNKTILKGLFTGKITSQEGLLAAVMKSWGINKKLSKASFKTWLSYRHEISVFDIIDFTTNADVFISKLNSETLHLYKDVMDTAKLADKMINPLWSEKRLTEEHLEWSREIMMAEIGSKESVPVYISALEAAINNIPQVQMLNTEAAVFAEGYLMHHCLYTCYWRDIVKGTYIAVHINDINATLGMNIYHGKLEFNQAYHKYDRVLTEEEHDYAYTIFRTIKVLYEEALERDKIVLVSTKQAMENALQAEVVAPVPGIYPF